MRASRDSKRYAPPFVRGGGAGESILRPRTPSFFPFTLRDLYHTSTPLYVACATSCGAWTEDVRPARFTTDERDPVESRRERGARKCALAARAVSRELNAVGETLRTRGRARQGPPSSKTCCVVLVRCATNRTCSGHDYPPPSSEQVLLEWHIVIQVSCTLRPILRRCLDEAVDRYPYVRYTHIRYPVPDSSFPFPTPDRAPVPFSSRPHLGSQEL
ncbi:MAG: hypothetical protein AVDCRST_MAG93-7031 [uncultured Chloroflexia bacterium]|uniref:Uncharacterized protein n=1 Tax=uncultured Chloroflexia bacterium TaxID=1672391 RepID=A0A6J4M951_9CHLR|nr:MAG: hypothetical protein AVDCRST_MAG93-7031 [uncultured Chloroflexia bacterium]